MSNWGNWEEAEGLGLAQPGEEIAAGGPNGHLPVPTGQWSRRWSHTLAAVYGRMRHNGWKLKQGWFRLDIRSNFFLMGAGRQWRRSSREAVKTPLLEAFKSCLDKDLSNLTGDPTLSWRLDQRPPDIPSNLNPSMVLQKEVNSTVRFIWTPAFALVHQGCDLRTKPIFASSKYSHSCVLCKGEGSGAPCPSCVGSRLEAFRRAGHAILKYGKARAAIRCMLTFL